MPEGRIYLDNAATTRLDSRVSQAMLPFLEGEFGNPSSIHSFGRESKARIERARKKIASLINAKPSEIVFTSGGTEADNLAIISSIRTLGIRQAISSPLEHHAVLHTLEKMAESGHIELKLVEADSKGNLNFDQMRRWLDENPHSFVSFMQANNEIGNLYPVEVLAAEVKERGGVFHSDTVQTMGKLPHDFESSGFGFLIASAHKFHGPKGVGFIAVSSDLKVMPYITGGSQERGMRGGTENIMGIVGMAEALEIAMIDLDANRMHISALKKRLIQRLTEAIPDVRFNGLSAEESGLYTILNVSFPPAPHTEMLLANLDIRGIAVSGGSACSSGSDVGSHVLRAMNTDPARASVRFSFSKFNTVNEIETTAREVCSLFQSTRA